MKTIVVQHSTLVNPLTTTTAGSGFPWWRAAGIAYSSFRIRETEVEQLRVGQRMKLMVCGNRLEIAGKFLQMRAVDHQDHPGCAPMGHASLITGKTKTNQTKPDFTKPNQITGEIPPNESSGPPRLRHASPITGETKTTLAPFLLLQWNQNSLKLSWNPPMQWCT